MKYTLVLLLALLSLANSAQELPKNSKIFVRIFDEHDKKIAKGRVVAITDKFITLKRMGKTILIPSSNVFYIKTKRSKGHNVLVGSLIGGAIPIIGISTQSNTNTIDKIIAYILTPAIATIGGGFGYLTTLFKNSKSYFIYYDQKRWQEFKEAMYAPQN